MDNSEIITGNSDYMTLAETAEFLRCGKQKLYSDKSKKGRHIYPFYRDLSGRILYSRKELTAMIQARRVASDAELQAEAERVINGK